jgi:HK97 family phage portal protein
MTRRVEPPLTRARASTSVDSSVVRRGDGVWEAFVGGGANGAPSETTALAVSAVYACVNLIAGAISALPMLVYSRAADGDMTLQPSHPYYWMLNEEFSARWPASAGWSWMVKSRMFHGDAFAEIIRGPGGSIRGLRPLHPNRVRPVVRGEDDRIIYDVHPDPTVDQPAEGQNRLRVVDQDDMLHVPGFGFDGKRSLSPLRAALVRAGRLAISAQDFSTRFLENMARPDFALKTPGNLTDDQYAQLQQRLEQHRSPINAGRPMILEGGLDIKELTMPLEDVQLLETRRFQVEEIARIYGVPPFMIGHMDKTTSWGSGVEAMGVGFVRFTLRDHLNAFQNEINRKFFRRPGTVAEFDTTELERADTKSLYDALRIGLGRAGEPAFLTVEEVRQMLRLPKQMQGTVPVPQQPEGDAA